MPGIYIPAIRSIRIRFGLRGFTFTLDQVLHWWVTALLLLFLLFLLLFLCIEVCVWAQTLCRERDNCTAVLLAACCMPGKTGLAQEVQDHPFLATCKPISIAMRRYIKSQTEGSSLFTQCFSYLEIWDSSEV